MALAPRFDDADLMLPAGVSAALASPRESLMVLTRDGELLGTLRNVATGHVIMAVDGEPELAGLLIHDHGGVALIDAAAVSSPIAQLTQRLKSQFPDLVLVVAGDAQDQAALGPQITSGMVYRFLHKPVSEQRVRLFVAAAWRRHGEEHAGMSGISATRTTRVLPVVRRSRKPLWAALLAGAAIASAVAWFSVQDPQSLRSISRPQGVIARDEPQPTAAPAADVAEAEIDLEVAQWPIPTDALDATVERSIATSTLPTFESAESDVPALVAEGTPALPAESIILQASDALAADRVDEGERLIQLAAEAGAPPEQLDELVSQARDLRIAMRAGAMSRLTQRFNDRIAQGQLIEPETDSARFYLGELTRTEPGHPSIRFAREALSSRLVAEGRGAIARKELPAARRWLKQAEEVGADSAGVAALEREIDAAELTASKMDEVVSPAALTRLHHVNPIYPVAARNRGTEGWVDLAITVEPDGTVGAVAVTRADPAMVFDAAAIAAVRQWRYEPVRRNGTAVSQRTKVRIRFELQ